MLNLLKGNVKKPIFSQTVAREYRNALQWRETVVINEFMLFRKSFDIFIVKNVSGILENLMLN